MASPPTTSDYLTELSAAEAQERTRRFVPSTSDRDFVVSVLSRVDIEKGTDLALHAIRILRSAGVPARLRLIGDSLDGAAFRSVIEEAVAARHRQRTQAPSPAHLRRCRLGSEGASCIAPTGIHVPLRSGGAIGGSRSGAETDTRLRLSLG